MGDEELRAVCAGSRVCHREDALFVVLQAGVEFIAKLVTRAAATGAGWVAALHHEITDYAMEDNAVVKTFASEEYEIVHGHRGLVCK